MLHNTHALRPIWYEIGTKIRGPMAKPAKPALVCVIGFSLAFSQTEDVLHKRAEVVIYDRGWLAVDKPTGSQSPTPGQRSPSDKV